MTTTKQILDTGISRAARAVQRADRLAAKYKAERDELLAALRDLLNFTAAFDKAEYPMSHNRSLVAQEAARAAIAKAEGQS